MSKFQIANVTISNYLKGQCQMSKIDLWDPYVGYVDKWKKKKTNQKRFFFKVGT